LFQALKYMNRRHKAQTYLNLQGFDLKAVRV